MFEGNQPQNSMALIHEFGILSILLKFPDDSEELKDKELVYNLTSQSVKICQVLGHLFSGFKKQL